VQGVLRIRLEIAGRLQIPATGDSRDDIKSLVMDQNINRKPDKKQDKKNIKMKTLK
jgi:ribosomal protein L19E